MKLTEHIGDLFSLGIEWSLAHCISKDAKMGGRDSCTI